MQEFIIYTDGGYSTSSNVGSAAYVILAAADGSLVKKDSFILRNETSQRAEIKAILAALYTIPDGSRALIHTDYLFAVLSLHRPPRRKNQPDADLLLCFKKLVRQKQLRVDFKWVRSHDGDPWNELCDTLCTEALAEVEAH